MNIEEMREQFNRTPAWGTKAAWEAAAAVNPTKAEAILVKHTGNKVIGWNASYMNGPIWRGIFEDSIALIRA